MMILDAALGRLYGADAVEGQKQRYARLLQRFTEEFGDGKPQFFRAPGRTEIGGNHTDHQHGQVLAAAINLDIAAAAAPRDDKLVRIFSEGFGFIEIDLDYKLTEEEKEAEKGKATALVRGVAEEMRKRGYRVGGCSVYASSNVPEGSGLSSSAAFEILAGIILSSLYNNGTVRPEELAQIAQTAENCYYGKPCGLMDQMTIATGGLCRIDFSDPQSPAMEKLNTDFHKMGYCICITNTHGSHADHTEDYAAVQTDLAKAAGVFGKKVLEGITLKEVVERAGEIRRAGGDRAFLRAMHIALENERVVKEATALKENNMPAFLDLVRRSGDSSYKLLQNVHVDRTPEKQELAVALAISEAILEGKGDSACRVHGGGFAGTIQAFVPSQFADEYCIAMNAVFGQGSCFRIRICPEGGVQIGK
ncbi:MAG: galactokinase [Clostridiales bacterium]|nr:galactokinase [Clostridiales bacterium]